MKSWESAFAQLRRRSLSQLIEALAVDAPFSFDPSSERSDVPDFIEANWESYGEEANQLISLPGRDVNYVRDVLICASKFHHVVESVRRNIASGSMTWAIVDAYHASLLGTRLFAAGYGVLSYTVKKRTVLIDYRPDLGSPTDQKEFRKQSKNIENPVRLLRPQSKLLEQSDSWLLVLRLCNIAAETGEVESALSRIKHIAASRVSVFRNGVLYDSVAWEWLDDFSKATVASLVQLDRLGDDTGTHSLTLQALSEIFDFTIVATTQLCAAIGYDPAEISNISHLRGPAPNLLG